MELFWNEQHGKIFSDIINGLNENKIRYFILRNYEGLPNVNPSKDVDIIIEPHKLNEARNILMSAYRNNNIQYYKEELFGKIHSFWGVITTKEFSIHIDLIEGYFAKGFEIFLFDELYAHTENYKEFYVLDEFFTGVMLYIYKQFGYKHPKFKDEYKEEICTTYAKYPKEFEKEIAKLTGEDFAEEICKKISNQDFDGILADTEKLTSMLRKYVWKKRPFTTLVNILKFALQRAKQSVFCYRKYSSNFSVLAPDGTGKTTFLDTLLDRLNFYRVCRPEDNHFNVYHFRPNILPNLGEMGEKAGVMKQDTDFTNPHRNKPANPLSSFVRISYYTLDYIIGWHICVRKDTRRNKWSIFDRYSYDLIVDPLRTRLNLPEIVRRFFVKITPKPNLIFYLNAEPEVIYKRKQELEPEEISRQIKEYQKVAAREKRIITLDANKTPEQLADEAVEILLSKYMKKL